GLAAEPELGAAMIRLRSERAARLAAWQSLQPDEAEAERFAAGVRAAVRRYGTWGRLARWARPMGAAAACAMFFLAGWLGRGHIAANVAVRSEPARSTGHTAPAGRASSGTHMAK